jgi:hypothetical protein
LWQQLGGACRPVQDSAPGAGLQVRLLSDV